MIVILIQAESMPYAYCDLPTIEDEHYKDACGPIACLVALRSLGIEASLAEAVKKCDWEEGKFTPLKTMEAAIQSYRGIDAQLAKLSPQELSKLLTDDQTVVILATRKSSQEINHAVCAVAVENDGQAIRWIDYPELTQKKMIGEVTEVWDGPALVVRISPFYRALDKFALLSPLLIVSIVGVLWLYGRRQGKTAPAMQSKGGKSMRIGKYLIILLVVLFCTCHKREETVSNEKNSPAESHKNKTERCFYLKHNFGDVDKDSDITGKIELKNEDKEPIVLTLSKASCGCFNVTSMPKNIEPGETGVFEVKLNTKGKQGLQQLQAIFWNEGPKPCFVKLAATATIRSCWINPETFNLGNLVSSDPFKKELFVVAAGFPDAKVLSVSTEAKWIALKQKNVATPPQLEEEGIKAIDCYDVEWNGKDATPGVLSAKIVVKIKTDKEQILEVPVTGYLSGDVTATPPLLVFGLLSKTEIVRNCTLKFNHPVDMAKIKVAAEHSSVNVEVVLDQKVPNQFNLTARASLPEKISDKLFQGNISGVNNDGKTIFCIPYSGVFNRVN
jgi:hypothetical protein